jgi:voltage-gated potassium channel
MILKESALMGDNFIYKGNNHFIIIGWNERVRTLFTYLEESLFLNEIVLIDNTLETPSVLSQYVYFIKGDPTDSQTLVKANIKYATTILITANAHQPEEEADLQSLISLIASKGQNPSIYSVVEILTSKQIVNARHAGADQIIHRSLPISRLMYDKLFSKKMSY